MNEEAQQAVMQIVRVEKASVRQVKRSKRWRKVLNHRSTWLGLRLQSSCIHQCRSHDSHVLQARVKHLPPLVRTLPLDADYDDGVLIATCALCGIEVLSPLSKTVGKSTPQARRDRATYLASPQGKARY